MPEKNTTVEHDPDYTIEEKKTYLPPALTSLVDLSVGNLPGAGADAGGYSGNSHS